MTRSVWQALSLPNWMEPQKGVLWFASPESCKIPIRYIGIGEQLWRSETFPGWWFYRSPVDEKMTASWKVRCMQCIFRYGGVLQVRLVPQDWHALPAALRSRQCQTFFSTFYGPLKDSYATKLNKTFNPELSITMREVCSERYPLSNDSFWLIILRIVELKNGWGGGWDEQEDARGPIWRTSDIITKNFFGIGTSWIHFEAAKGIIPKGMINLINYIHFMNRHVFTLLQHPRYDEYCPHEAYPEPCIDHELTCRWDENLFTLSLWRLIS